MARTFDCLWTQTCPNLCFLTHFRLDPAGALTFYFSRKHLVYFLYTKHIFQAHPGPRWSAHAGPIQGPGEVPPDPETDELSGPNQGPLPTRPGKKYVAQGTLAATLGQVWNFLGPIPDFLVKYFIKWQKFLSYRLEMKTNILTRRDLSHYGPQRITWTGRKWISSKKWTQFFVIIRK